MGLLNLFSKAAAGPAAVPLPSGSFTVDGTGRVVASTLPRSFPEPLLAQIAQAVLSTWSGAQSAQMRLQELHIQYPAFKISAREMRGGAIIFLAPRAGASR